MTSQPAPTQPLPNGPGSDVQQVLAGAFGKQPGMPVATAPLSDLDLLFSAQGAVRLAARRRLSCGVDWDVPTLQSLLELVRKHWFQVVRVQACPEAEREAQLRARLRDTASLRWVADMQWPTPEQEAELDVNYASPPGWEFSSGYAAGLHNARVLASGQCPPEIASRMDLPTPDQLPPPAGLPPGFVMPDYGQPLPGQDPNANVWTFPQSLPGYTVSSGSALGCGLVGPGTGPATPDEQRAASLREKLEATQAELRASKRAHATYLRALADMLEDEPKKPAAHVSDFLELHELQQRFQVPSMDEVLANEKGY